MIKSRFVKMYLMTIVALCIIYGILYDLGSRLTDHLDLVVITLIGYSFLAFLHRWKYQKLRNYKDKNVLFVLTVSHMMVKLIFSIIVLVLYYKLTEPVSNSFALAFIITYVAFGILEGIYSVKQVG